MQHDTRDLKYGEVKQTSKLDTYEDVMVLSLVVMNAISKC